MHNNMQVLLISTLTFLPRLVISLPTHSSSRRLFVEPVITTNLVRYSSQSSADTMADTPPNDDDRPAPSLFHHFTVCMVPPEGNDRAWEELTKARTELRDPGLFRWPPHANLLYPFIDPTQKVFDPLNVVSSTETSSMDQDILEKLRVACQQIEPFTVRLDRIGTFGGAKRGVLWMYPSSFRGERSRSNDQTEPLIQLQACLQDEFPYCDTQQKVSGIFNPHMTLSHFVNLEKALEAQTQIETWWDMSIEFVIDEIYLLYRKDDGGQFERLVTLGLGAEGQVTVHDPPSPFDYMPRKEVEWVREERMKLKQRRNRKGSRGGRQRRGGMRPPPDTPEVIAQKRAERQAKRDAFEKQAPQTENSIFKNNRSKDSK